MNHLRISTIFVEALDKEGISSPAIKKDGVPCAAQVKIITKKDRLTKNADVEILIDQSAWNASNDEERKAIIDHELTHVVMRLSKKDGLPKRDDDGKLCLKLRRHDLVYWGFSDIFEKHKNNSVEYHTFVDLQHHVNSMISRMKEASHPTATQAAEPLSIQTKIQPIS
jgi:hypothetical protein